MTSIRLPAEIENRLNTLAKTTGKTKAFYIREAVMQYLEDLEDIHLAERISEDIRSGKEAVITLEEWKKQHGVRNQT